MATRSRASVLFLVWCIGLGAASVVEGAVEVKAVVLDLGDGVTPQGDWTGRYGQCFSLLPSPLANRCEQLVGPDPFSNHGSNTLFDVCTQAQPGNQPQYFDTCVRGDLAGAVDYRVYVTHNNQPFTAFQWTWDSGVIGGGSTLDGVGQVNDCRGGYYDAVFDNEDFALDPLVSEITLPIGTNADLRVAYYFFNSQFECRNLAWDLYIDDVLAASSTPATILVDFKAGQYLVFTLGGIPVDKTLKVALKLKSGGVACGTAHNSVLGGVFVSGPVGSLTQCLAPSNQIPEDARAFCAAGPNPSGNVPNDGTLGKAATQKGPAKTTGGDRPSGHYTIGSTTGFVCVMDNDNTNGPYFGPFEAPINIKYTEANGAKPGIKEYGGPNSAVPWHINGQGDMAVFPALNTPACPAPNHVQVCLVPPPPK